MRKSIFALVFAGSAPALAGDLVTDGFEAFRNGRYSEAYALLYPAAKSANADAKYLVGRMLDEGLAGELAPDRALPMLIGAARLGHRDAKVLVEQTKGCVAKLVCDGTESVEVWTCGSRQVRMPPLTDRPCNQAGQNQQAIEGLIERRKIVDRYFGDPIPGGRDLGPVGSAEECAVWAAAAGPNERRVCHQGLK